MSWGWGEVINSRPNSECLRIAKCYWATWRLSLLTLFLTACTGCWPPSLLTICWPSVVDRLLLTAPLLSVSLLSFLTGLLFLFTWHADWTWETSVGLLECPRNLWLNYSLPRKHQTARIRKQREGETPIFVDQWLIQNPIRSLPLVHNTFSWGST